MNLVETLGRELKDKHYTEFQKARYIYIRCCQIFSFDARWNYYTLFTNELIEKIEMAMFNVTSIDTPLVICHSFSKSILKPLLDELTTMDVDVVSGSHSYVEMHNRGDKWILDATNGDFPRAKMGLITEGFHSKYLDFPMEVFDNELGFSYSNRSKYSIFNWSSGYDVMDKVSAIISKSKCRYHYSDVAFLYNYMTYLMKQSTKTILDSKGSFVREIHFGENNEDYEISKVNGEYLLHMK